MYWTKTRPGPRQRPDLDQELDNLIFRPGNFYEKFLEWKIKHSFFQFELCLSLNFDYYDTKLSIPQIATTPEDELKLTFDFPRSCFFVIVGGKYLNKIGSVMEKVNNITTDIGGTRPLAVFIISNTNKDNIDIDINHGFDRYKSTPVMVI